MLLKELFNTVNKRLKNKGRPSISKKRFIEIIAVLEATGVVVVENNRVRTVGRDGDEG